MKNNDLSKIEFGPDLDYVSYFLGLNSLWFPTWGKNSRFLKDSWSSNRLPIWGKSRDRRLSRDNIEILVPSRKSPWSGPGLKATWQSGPGQKSAGQIFVGLSRGTCGTGTKKSRDCPVPSLANPWKKQSKPKFEPWFTVWKCRLHIFSIFVNNNFLKYIYSMTIISIWWKWDIMSTFEPIQ